MLKELNQYKEFRNLVTLFAVILAGFMQAAIIQIFMRPLNLLSSGFTGVAILIEKITSTFFGFTFSTSLGMLALNIPVALFCSKSISKSRRGLGTVRAGNFFIYQTVYVCNRKCSWSAYGNCI